MLALERQHTLPSMMSRRRMAPAFDLSLSLLTNPAMNHHTAFYPLEFGLQHGLVGHLDVNAFGSSDTQEPMSLPPSFTVTHEVPQAREARNAIVEVDSSPLVKAESASPEDFGFLLCNDPLESLEIPAHPQEANFGTDVDVLMRTIQTKTKSRPQQQSTPSSYGLSACRSSSTTSTRSGSDPERGTEKVRASGKTTRKRYECDTPSCTKSFFQKTHLEIHMRAHTGYKPFVSNPGHRR